jgi:hypothetical protein
MCDIQTTMSAGLQSARCKRRGNDCWNKEWTAARLRSLRPLDAKIEMGGVGGGWRLKAEEVVRWVV